MILKPFMRTLLVLFISFCLAWSCKNSNKDSGELSLENPISKKDKFLVEAERDVESIDTSIVVNPDDFIRIGMNIFPSFDEAHYIDLDFNNQEIAVYQITQTNDLYITNEYFELPNSEKEDYLYQRMKENKTKDFRFTAKKDEINELLDAIKQFKQSKYKVKSVEIFDGSSFYMGIIEKDTIIYLGTNSPSSHQKKFLKKLFDICRNNAKDSITKRNISNLIEYL